MANSGLDPAKFGTHSLREGGDESRIESCVKYLDIEVDDAIEIAAKIDI